MARENRYATQNRVRCDVASELRCYERTEPLMNNAILFRAFIFSSDDEPARKREKGHVDAKYLQS